MLQERSQKPCEAAGAYLAACAFHALIHDESPQGLPASLTPASIQSNPEGLSDAGTVPVAADDAALMQEIVWSTTSQWREKMRAWYLQPGRK